MSSNNPHKDKKLPWPGSRPPVIATVDHRDRRPSQPSAATTAARAASAISGQNLVEGFAGAGVGVDRAGQVGGGQALLDGQRHQVDQLLGVDH